MNNDDKRIKKAKGRIQKLQLFIRGNAISGAPICIGIIQLASPTNAGMTAPNTMIKPCMVVIWLKKFGSTSCNPGWNNSARMISAMIPPIMNIHRLKIRYIDPMSLWFVVYNQRPSPFAGPWWCGSSSFTCGRSTSTVAIILTSYFWIALGWTKSPTALPSAFR